MDSSSRDINEANLPFVEELYFAYLADPAAVEPAWRHYFDSLHDGPLVGARPGPSFVARSIFDPAAPTPTAEGGRSMGAEIAWDKGRAVERLVDVFRHRGHLVADVNPIAAPPAVGPEFVPQHYGLTESDLLAEVPDTGIAGLGRASVADMIDTLRRAYCGHVALEMEHVSSAEMRAWLAERMEQSRGEFSLPAHEARYALERVTHAEVFEQFLHTKFVGAKRFSLEGGEGLIPLIDFMLDEGAHHELQQVYIGMAHRGRLNVLTHIIRKDPRNIFLEFEDSEPLKHLGSGDVKYHKGSRSDTKTLSGKGLRVALTFNPSHLEFVYPVVTGRVYALQQREADTSRRTIAPLVIHGDSSVIGQGIVAETLNLAGLPGYHVGGVVHIVVNNQIGFTTPAHQARSSVDCTAVAQIAEAPVFRVHGDDIAAVAWVGRTAMRFRQLFGRDVFVDLMCFRKYGHNEGDEPYFTQPLMYSRIKNHPGVRKLFADALVASGTISADAPRRMAEEYAAKLDEGLRGVREGEFHPTPVTRHGAPIWDDYVGGYQADVPDVETKVPKEELQRLLRLLAQVPAGFDTHRAIRRLLTQREEAAEEARPLDWGLGESLAFATLLDAGIDVRLDGQDAERGTFAHRHSVLHDQETGETYSPLRNLRAGQGFFDVVNSALSEAAVMGFDYGYSREAPDALVMWEAQFGDFANGAQVIIDQFVSAAEDKWGILTGLVLLLPHGFEGQGPEHSSARLERFLALCAQDNLQVCYPTTPAQLFHVLRRQVLRPLRKPLVIMTPKSLLRHKLCVSALSSFYDGRFKRVIGDRGGAGRKGIEPSRARRIILCTGKVYYDLASEREERSIDDVALIRMEQLYPLPKKELLEELSGYPDGIDLVWVQEEPWNMGAWYYMRARLPHILGDRYRLRCVSRAESASPATGSKAAHEHEQARLVAEALTGEARDFTPDTAPPVHP